MEYFVILLGLIVVLLGFLGMLKPTLLIGLTRSFWSSSKSLYYAIGIRLTLGIILILVGPNSRFPSVIQLIGVIAIVGAIAIPLIGAERIQSIISWWLRQPTWFIRMWSVVVIIFGGFLIFSVC